MREVRMGVAWILYRVYQGARWSWGGGSKGCVCGEVGCLKIPLFTRSIRVWSSIWTSSSEVERSIALVQ